MTSPVEYRYARAKVKPIAGSPDGVPQTAPVAPVPTAPDSSQAGAPAGLTDAQKLVARRAALQAALKAEADKKLADEEAAKAAEKPTEPTGTAELPQAGEAPTAAPATSPETTVASETVAAPGAAVTSVPPDVLAYLKAHPEAEALIEKLAAQGK